MRAFADPEAAERARERIEELTGLTLTPDFLALFEDNPSPDRALTNLERWLKVTSSPGLYLAHLIGLPRLCRLLVTIIGASQPLADSLIQNPELASLILDPTELGRIPTAEGVVAEGRDLLRSSTSYSHSLDRLRYLKQRWTLPIVINDLEGTWPEEQVWTALSALAFGLIELAYEVSWSEFAKSKGIEGPCPVAVIAFGKLGGRELNYSSDVDLVYVCQDGLDERAEAQCTRFAEALNRALGDRMGRSSLYRVDLRLRPFGGAGALVRSMRSVEAYYELYAEPWEVQALLRSTPVVGPSGIADRWRDLVARTCFRPRLGEAALEHMLQMRVRIEEMADPDDLKRGAGGIRDVEFLTQALQMVHGYEIPDARAPATCDALRALDRHGVLDHAVASSLIAGYTFLRQLEHRCQLVNDQQTHRLPDDAEGRNRLARMMGLSTWPELARALEVHRRTIQTLYQSTLHPEPAVESVRSRVVQALGPLAHAAIQWFDTLPESEAYYLSLAENEGSLERVRTILTYAPALVPHFKGSLALTEALMSGEIEEEIMSGTVFDRVPLDAQPRVVADVYRNAWATLAAQWVLSGILDLGVEISALTDALITHCARRLYAEFDVVGLGSYGVLDSGLESDTDMVFLVDKVERHPDAEIHAQHMLSLLAQLKRLGAPIAVDLRLRPEGGKGLLVRTYDGFRSYELESMEMWERFALGQARLIVGDPEAERIVLKSAYAQPLTPERLKELLAMKKRIETERVNPQYLRREVKLGWGGLNDIEWFVHLHEMRYPTATRAGSSQTMDERIRELLRAGLINAVEADHLTTAREHLLAVRARLTLLGLTKDLIPENPDKLDRLAHACGEKDANSFLATHERVIDRVRAVYQDGLERLKA